MIIPLLISCEVRAFWYLYLYGIYIYINSIRGTAKLVLFPCNAIIFLVCTSQYQKFIVWWLEIQLCFPGTIVMWKPCWSLGFQTCHSFLEEKVTGLTFYTYIYYLFMHPEQSCSEIQQRLIQLVLFISVFQINANDSLWPWSCDQTVGDFKTGKPWLIAGLGGGGTGGTIFPGPWLTRDRNWNQFTAVLML